MNKIKALLLIIAVSLLMTACEDQEKNKLDNRVIDFWNYKIEKNFKEAYKYLSPGWKTTESEDSYVKRMSLSKADWKAVEIDKKVCKQKDLCEMKLTITYSYTFKGASGQKMQVKSNIKENWILKNNTWYHLPVKQNLK